METATSSTMNPAHPDGEDVTVLHSETDRSWVFAELRGLAAR